MFICPSAQHALKYEQHLQLPSPPSLSLAQAQPKSGKTTVPCLDKDAPTRDPSPERGHGCEVSGLCQQRCCYPALNTGGGSGVTRGALEREGR